MTNGTPFTYQLLQLCFSEQMFYRKQSLGAPVRSLPTFVIYLLCSIDFRAACVAWAGFFKAGREKSQVRSRVQGEKTTSSRVAFKKPNNNLLQVRIFCRR